MEEFYAKKASGDGRAYTCRSCSSLRAKEYYRTKEGLITKIYGTQRGHSRTRSHDMPDYSLIELREWALAQPIFHELFDNWVSSNYHGDLRPSFDRGDDYQGYSLDRLEIMTWEENRLKAYSDMRGGVNNKNSKAVIQMTLDGEFIAEHHSSRHAWRVTKVFHQNISACCTGKAKSAGGYAWRFSNAKTIKKEKCKMCDKNPAHILGYCPDCAKDYRI